MKKVISIILLLCLLCCFHSAYSDNERVSGLYTYKLKGNGTIIISGFDWGNNSGDIYIPSMIDGYSVTAIDSEAFMCEENNMLSPVIVTLPDTIKSIGSFAFMFAPISTIDIPASVVEIGEGAFAGAKVIKFGVAPDHEVFATIDGVLYNKRTKTLIAYPLGKDDISPIPEGITTIGAYSFAYCRFEDYSYYKQGLFLPTSLKRIDNYAFFHGTLPLQMVVNAKEMILDSGAGTLTVDSIGDHAFDSADLGVGISVINGLARAVINTGVIGDSAFYNSPTDRRVMLFINTCRSIGNSAFENSGKIMIAFKEDCGIESIGDRAFFKANLRGYPSDAAIYYIEDVSGEHSALTNESFALPKECKSIGVQAFENMTAFNTNKDTKLILPVGIEKVPSRAFTNVNNIYDLIIPEGYIEIGDNAFSGMSKLEKVTLPSSLERISIEAFSNCQELNEVVVQDGLRIIGDKAFSSCNKLKVISIPDSVEQIGDLVFTREVITLKVGRGSYADYWAEENGYTHDYSSEQTEDLTWLND